jgi:midasin
VGKTSLISALAKASGHNLVRINLSEQTDIADLLGCDLPVASNSADGTDSAIAPDSGEWQTAMPPPHQCLSLGSQNIVRISLASQEHRVSLSAR